MKKALALIMAVFMAAGLLAACGSNTQPVQTSGSGSSETQGQQNTSQQNQDQNQSQDSGKKTLIKVGLNDACDTLAPWGPNKITKQVVDSSIFQTMAQVGDDGELEPVLASDWENTGTATYKVTLYDYIVDTEGNALTASDVKFSWEKFSEVSTNYLDEITVDGDYELTVKLNTEAPGTFEILMTNVFICTEDSYNASGDEMATKPVGTTQYRLIDFVANNKIVLEKVDSYWQSEDLGNPLYAANADYIEYDILTESTQLNLALEQGTVVIGRDVGYDLLPSLEAKGLELHMIDDQYDRGIMFCMTEDSPFYDNLALRQAVCYAINKEAVCEAVTSVYGEVSKTTYGKPSQNGYNSAWETDPYAYDPEKAKEKLKEAGYAEGELTLVALSNENPDCKTMWTMIQSDLAEIGITMEINFASGSSYGAYRDATSGQYDIAYFGMDYGDYVTTAWSTLYDDRIRSSGLTCFGLDDDTVREKIRELTTAEGYTQENIDDFYEYTSENCFFYQLYYQPSVCVYDPSKISNIDGAHNFKGYTFVNALELADGWDTFYN